MGWSPYPGIEPTWTLVAEAHGAFTPHPDLPEDDDGGQDLHGAFRAGAALMGCQAPGNGRARWGMHEAELTPAEPGTRAGWAQVGLEEGVDPFTAMPAMAACLTEAMGRFGHLDLTGVRVTGDGPACPADRAFDLVAFHNWFATARGRPVPARIVIEDVAPGRVDRDRLVAWLEEVNLGRFILGRDTSRPAPDGAGVAALLPEWSPYAIGVALAFALAGAAAQGPGVERFAVRLAR